MWVCPYGVSSISTRADANGVLYMLEKCNPQPGTMTRMGDTPPVIYTVAN